MKKLSILLCFVFVLTLQSFAQDIPERPNPPRLVNDIAGVMTSSQVNSLEDNLEDFARRTSNQIVVVTVPDLNGNDISDYSFRLGEKWGVGQKDKDNGITIVFKPKTSSSKGQVFIAVGYGLEGIIPDAVANRIVENEMIPHFKTNDIYGGFLQATTVLKSLAEKEYSSEEYVQKTGGNGLGLAGVVLFIAFVIFGVAVFSSKRQYATSGTHSSSSIPFWLLLGGMGSSSRSGSWDNFSGGGGGFGGFGGGGFGGGGAGGSW